MLISIIIPVYNGEKYLYQCIKTLKEQTYNEWEAIFINDGSNDSTLSILDNSSKSDNRIKVFTQENKGAAAARNYGIEVANGDFITFLDVDDSLNENFLYTMIKEFDNDYIDIVVGTFNILHSNGTIISCKKIKSDLMKGIDFLKKVLSGWYGWELWGKMFRKKLFNNKPICPKDLRIGEDASVFIQIASNASYVKAINIPLYNYIQYTSSVSHIISEKHAEETLKAAFFIEEYLKTKNYFNDIKKETNGMVLLHYSNSTRRAFLSIKNKLIKKIYKENFNIGALMCIPTKKAIYICISLFFALINIPFIKIIRKIYL